MLRNLTIAVALLTLSFYLTINISIIVETTKNPSEKTKLNRELSISSLVIFACVVIGTVLNIAEDTYVLPIMALAYQVITLVNSWFIWKDDIEFSEAVKISVLGYPVSYITSIALGILMARESGSSMKNILLIYD